MLNTADPEMETIKVKKKKDPKDMTPEELRVYLRQDHPNGVRVPNGHWKAFELYCTQFAPTLVYKDAFTWMIEKFVPEEFLIKGYDGTPPKRVHRPDHGRTRLKDGPQ